METGKTTKYLKYAIGEIVLVMIGILLALQVNLWNDNKKKKKIGYQYLNEMRLDLEGDIKQLDFYIKELEEKIKNQEAALNSNDISKLPIDSLFIIMNYINLDFKTSEFTINKVKNLGITSLSNNDSLNSKITRYYDRHVVFLKKAVSFLFDDLRERKHYDLYEQNSIDLSFLYSDSYFPSLSKKPKKELEEELKSNIIDFIYSTRGRNIIINDYDGSKYALNGLNGFREVTVNLLESIYNELKLYNPNTKPLPDFVSESVQNN